MNLNENEFQKIKKGLIESLEKETEEDEEVDIEERDDYLDNLQVNLDVEEQRLVEQIRKEELLRQTLLMEEQRLNGIAQDRSNLQMRLVEKERQIQMLTSKVRQYEMNRAMAKPSDQMMEILAVSNGASDLNIDNMDDFQKMSKAEFLVAQLDLDPIESQYSQEQQQ